MAVDAREIWGLADVLSTPQGGAPRTMTGTVDSVDDQGTAWVSVPGSDAPVPAAVIADAEPGDVVTVTVADGRAAIEGNATSPAATVRRVDGVDARVDAVQADVAEAAQVAEEAAAVASATNQHFWARSTDPYGDGAGTGAFVTDEEQADFLAAIAAGTAPTDARPLHNILMNSLGILLRTAIRNLVSITRSAVAFYDGLGNEASNVTALFGSDGFQVGSASGSHLRGDYHSMRLVDAEGGTYFHVSDLRNASGIATLTETFVTETLTQTDFTVTLDIYDSSTVTATVNGTYTRCTVSGKTVTLLNPATWMQSVAITYTTQARNAKAYTLGIDRAGDIGPLSFMEGYANESSGHASHAEGRGTVASGSYAHAEGNASTASGFAAHTEGRLANASGANSHAEGMYSTASGNSAHAEGYDTNSTGSQTHAEGYRTTATKTADHAEGYQSMANGGYAHAQNLYTVANGESQTAIGKYNVADSTSALIIGNGTATTARSNALTVDWSGNVECGTVNNVDVTAIPIPQSGVVATRSVAAGSVEAVSVTFPEEFAAAPNVVCGLQSTQTQLMGNCSCVVTARSATGFTVALVNNSSSARNIGCYWIAL